MPVPAGPPFPPTHPHLLFPPEAQGYLLASQRAGSLTTRPLRLKPPSRGFIHEPAHFPAVQTSALLVRDLPEEHSLKSHDLHPCHEGPEP